MTEPEMIEKAHALAKTKPGYRYDPKKLEQIVRDGLFALPVYEPIITRGDQVIQYDGADVVCYKDGVETKRTKADETVVRGLIIQYAVEASQI